MRTDVLLTWISLGILAGVLYTAPKYILNKIGEQFETLSGDQIHQLRSLLDTPSFQPTGTKIVPKEVGAGSTESSCASADVQNSSSLSNGQGAIYNDKKEKKTCPKPTVVYKTQIQYVPEPAKECPDLRNFIKKDQIPCWNCKL
jgi:hypothetical protein